MRAHPGDKARRPQYSPAPEAGRALDAASRIREPAERVTRRVLTPTLSRLSQSGSRNATHEASPKGPAIRSRAKAGMGPGRSFSAREDGPNSHQVEPRGEGRHGPVRAHTRRGGLDDEQRSLRHSLRHRDFIDGLSGSEQPGMNAGP